MAETIEHRCEQHSWQEQLSISVINIHGKTIEHRHEQHSWQKQLSIGVSNIHGKNN
jgi:hypothetical protein